jgi:hypothetical protein
MHERLAVYVPDPDAPADAARTVAHIDRGSGIVGKRIVEADPAESPLLVYYEGNRYGAENMRLYAERVYHAARYYTWGGGIPSTGASRFPAPRCRKAARSTASRTGSGSRSRRAPT